MTFRPEGLVLGAGTVLATIGGQDDINLPPEHEARLAALLSAAYGRAIGGDVVGHIRQAMTRWAQGEAALAAVHLAHTGLGPLPHRREGARRLFLADRLVEAGAEPAMLMRALGLEPQPADLARLYNPNQPRVPKGNPGGGRWAAVGSQIAGAAQKIARHLSRALASEAALQLARFASRFPAAAVFGTVLLAPDPADIDPANKWQDVPGRPGLRYRPLKFQPGWELSYKNTDGQEQREVLQEKDGVLRNDKGQVVGRVLPGRRVAIDLASVAPSHFREDEPRLCPQEEPDRFGQGPDSIARAYEDQVKRVVNPERPTPSGWGMALINPETGNPVMFDDCQHTTGAMIEAKGPTFTDILRKAEASASAKWRVLDTTFGQADREVRAAGLRPVIWFFADDFAADYFRREFEETDKGRERIIVRVLHYKGRNP
jgi:hypothetical protein